MLESQKLLKMLPFAITVFPCIFLFFIVQAVSEIWLAYGKSHIPWSASAGYAGFSPWKYYKTRMLSRYYDTMTTCVYVHFCPIPYLSTICYSKNSSCLFWAWPFLFLCFQSVRYALWSSRRRRAASGDDSCYDSGDLGLCERLSLVANH